MSDKPHFNPSETCQCPQCTSLITGDCISNEPIQASGLDRIRLTRIYCRHCHAGWSIERIQVGQLWLPTERPMEQITDRDELRKLQTFSERFSTLQIREPRIAQTIRREHTRRVRAALDAKPCAA